MRQLLVIILITLAGCSQPAPPPAPMEPFRNVAAEAGINFTHATGATGRFNMPEIMGSGCALLDYDGDGDLDVLLLQGSGPLRLYRNDGMRFVDVTAPSGIDFHGYGMGVATGDFDNDGRVDLLITGFGGNALYRNMGGGVFRNVTAESPEIALNGQWSTGASFFDYDRDGKQDLVIITYLDYTIEGNKKCYAPSGEVTYCTPKVYLPTASHLYHNEGGRFVEVTKRAGFDRALGRGLGVAAFDANGDGWLDLFVANDGSANHLWINQKNGTFVERALESGVAYGEDGLAKAGMGVAVGDYNNDGHEDLLVLNLMREGATLFEGDGKGGFIDVSLKTSLHAATFPYTGFGVGWFDFDNDGWQDLFLANGAVTLREEQRGQPYPFQERNLLIRNHPFTTTVLPELGVSRGVAFGDVDNDGKVDLLVTMNNGQARLLRNQSAGRNWLSVQVDGGLGARVSMKAPGLPEQWRRVHTDSSYLSASDPRVHFGLGEAQRVDEVKVHWPDGTTKAIQNPKPNSVLRITR